MIAKENEKYRGGRHSRYLYPISRYLNREVLRRGYGRRDKKFLLYYLKYLEKRLMKDDGAKFHHLVDEAVVEWDWNTVLTSEKRLIKYLTYIYKHAHREMGLYWMFCDRPPTETF